MLTAIKRRGRGMDVLLSLTGSLYDPQALSFNTSTCFKSPWESLKTLEADAELSIGPTSDWEM